MDIDELAKAIAHEVESYTKEVDDVMKDEIDKLSNELVRDLKNDPIIPERTGKYKKGFRVKKTAEGTGYKKNTIYNTKYRLTHLLERGHETRNGGRTKAYPHWEHAQEKAETLDERIARRLSQ